MAIIPERRPRLAPLRSCLPRRALAGVALVVLPLVFAFAAPQQKKPVKDYALIYGTVFGPDGRSRYGIPVKVRRADEKKARWEAMSDHAGEFAVRVPPGAADYVVWADIKVPKGDSRPETKVHIENNERVDIGLHLTK